MRESLYRHMHLGLVLAMAYPDAREYPEALREAVRAVAVDPFWTAVELPPVYDSELAPVVRALVSSAGLVSVQASQGTILAERLDLGDPAERDRCLERLVRDLDSAAALGASAVALQSGPETDDARRPAALRATAELLQALADAAAQRRLDLLLETFDSRADRKRLIGPTTRAARLAAEVARPNFGLMLDLSHLPLLSEPPAQAVRDAGPHLRHVHLGSCVLDKGSPLFGDSHPGFASPGSVNGPAEVRDMFRACFDAGFFAEGRRPIVSVEVRPQPGETSETVLAAAKRTITRAWATL